MFWQSIRPFRNWNPWNDLEQISTRLNRLIGGDEDMDKDNTDMVAGQRLAQCSPRYAYWENDEAVFLAMEMPGVNEKSLEIDLQGNTLSVSGVMDDFLPEGFNKDCRVGSCGRKYARQFSLGDGLNHDEIKAVMKDGLLRLTLPKIKTTASRRIEVQGD
ncbi:MAG: Hsp20/alpha crystallin family protein [Oligosphaeraceae bacterium]|nr:Hsp20/alpha crystallin family protein [Oligosphaeraceae bacterium]